MKVTNEMIHPELRTIGTVIRHSFHFKKEATFRRIQKLIKVSRRFLISKNLQWKNYTTISAHNDQLKFSVAKSHAPKDNAVGVLWIHGGGYGVGVPEQDSGFAQNFIHAANCVVVLPDYRLSIDEPFPAALEDCYDTLVWMKEHAAELGIRSDQIFVGGNSAGGGLTAALSLLARDRGEVNIAFQMPLYPMLDDRMITSSSQNNDAPIWDTQANKVAWQMYLKKDYQKENVSSYAAPARAKNYRNLPPTYTFVGDIEPFFDETKMYINQLNKAGVKATMDSYPGCFHAFDQLSQFNIARKATINFLGQFIFATRYYFAEQK
ncbi:alpha/beta hydrolase [Tetragenococcus muriaticus]|uniref:alpha/beta hydrolase n=1 Tax=Tetragenococcus muriaticus TaxID=64642 RepID=UPI00041FB4C4|nr:alpha/beta hydrolase [Tetragenococcus muriaticus]GMA46036.1 putative esterase LipW [Tetragenococcus muriaticus]GMA47368.1 putative esterase LipW [Tetragenococcus muriaticus]